jgi:uncharacterized protein
MGFLGVLAVGLVAVLAMAWAGQRSLIYFPDRNPGPPPGDVTVLEVVTSDGISHRAWRVPAEGEAIARVLVFNGNAGHKAHRLPLARSLAIHGLEVVLFDYRGYGDTEGSPSERGLLRDAAAVAEAAFETDLPLVYFGESLGAAVATLLAVDRPPSALVLRSPFTSLADMARTHYPALPAGLLLQDRYEVEEAMGRLEVPVLVILGTADTIVPPALSRRVFEAATGPKQLVEMEGRDHNDPDLVAGAELADSIRTFLSDTLR